MLERLNCRLHQVTKESVKPDDSTSEVAQVSKPAASSDTTAQTEHTNPTNLTGQFMDNA